jgi:hypothetical protein
MARKRTDGDRPRKRTDGDRPRKGTPSQGEISRPIRIAITAFVVFNLFAIVSWCVPLESPLIARCRDLSLPYLRWTGLFQKWDMFAPDPSKLNNYVGAVITYRDGTRSLWNFPRMENLGFFEKYLKERYRKYANDNLRLDSNSALWPDAARYIARVNNQPSNPPITVGLVRYWSVVPPPGGEGSAPWNQYIFFRYNVAPGDLP